MERVFQNSLLSGEVKIPCSKSIAHRAIVCASLAHGESVVRNVNSNDDIKATSGVMRALGASIREEGETLYIKGSDGTDGVCEAFCNESGSTLRFCVPVSAMLNAGLTHFTGRGKLGSRPMKIFNDIWDEKGLVYLDKSKGGMLDLYTTGRLGAGIYSLPADVSSQFISGLLFALPLADGDSEIRLTTPLASRGYVDLTLGELARFGVDVAFDGEKIFYIKGNSRYKAQDVTVEGDWSQAAFFKVANYLGNNVDVKGLDADSAQGDRIIDDYLKRLSDEKGELVFSGEDCPDIIPVFSVACALREGRTRLTGLSRLRIKECDRLAATYEMLSALGANVSREGDDLVFDGVKRFKGNVKVSSHHDHRMAMSAAIASTACDGSIIVDDCECMNKSYPRFLEDYAALGGKVL